MQARTRRDAAAGTRSDGGAGVRALDGLGQGRSFLLIAAALVLANLLVYGQTFRFGYVNFDDDVGLFKNPIVRQGLTTRSLAWAFTTFHLGNWIPLSWLTHLLDFQIFGARPGWHHLVNVAIHAASTVLLFALFARWTRSPGAGALAAALFSLHPLRVESVAWIIERKDVLSAFLGILTIWLYVRHAGRPASRGLSLAVLAAFTLGLLAKPMLVTLPFVLLLLDLWPLGRLDLFRDGAVAPDTARSSPARSSLAGLIVEKIPLLAIAFVFSVITLLAQRQGGAVRPLEQIPLVVRIANAVVACATYLGRTIWPSGLAVYYPYDLHLSPVTVAVSALLLAGGTVAAVLCVRRRPYVTVGWLWYVGTLVPVIGLVQVGAMAAADRYTYLPSIGLLILAVPLGLDLTKGKSRLALGAAGGIAALALGILSWRQAGYWRSSVVLFERALAVTKGSALAHYNLASGLAQEGRIDEAIVHYEETLRLAPLFPDANNNLGLALASRGRAAEAKERYLAELRRNPRHAEARCHLGVALAMEGKLDEALAAFSEAARLDPDYADAHYDRGLALEKLGRREEAIAAYSRALELSPDNADTEYNLALLLANEGRLREALALLSRLVEVHPDHPHAREDLLSLQRRLGSRP